MFLKAYSLLDTKTGAYFPPVFLQADAVALRHVFEYSMDRNSDLSKYPSDFVLYRIGEFDNSVGQLFATTPVNLGSVSSIIAAMRADVEASRFEITGEGVAHLNGGSDAVA